MFACGGRLLVCTDQGSALHSFLLLVALLLFPCLGYSCSLCTAVCLSRLSMAKCPLWNVPFHPPGMCPLLSCGGLVSFPSWREPPLVLCLWRAFILMAAGRRALLQRLLLPSGVQSCPAVFWRLRASLDAVLGLQCDLWQLGLSSSRCGTLNVIN